jgi:hypothetical protein
MAAQPAYSHPGEKPSMVTLISILTLVNGILNILWGLGAAVAFISSIIGIVCVPLAAFPIVLGILEILYAAKLLPASPRPVQPARYLAIIEIIGIVFGNVFSLIVGILALVFYNDPAVQAYFARLNAQPDATAPLYPSTQ